MYSLVTITPSTSRSVTSTEILSQIGSVHNIESNSNSSLGIFSSSSSLFTSHWRHLSVIFSWASALYFHVAWTGNYELWILNPLDTLPIGPLTIRPTVRKYPLWLMFCKIYLWPLSHTTYRRCYYKWPDLCHRFFISAFILSIFTLILSVFSFLRLYHWNSCLRS